MSAVTFSQVTKRYKDGPKAVDALDLDIADGEFMVLVGPSGCGKSTALRMLAGLEEITGGELRIDEQVVNDLPPGDRDIAMVFQNYALYPHMTVRENIGFALEVAKMDKTEARGRVENAAEMLGLTEYLDRLPKALSGGQRQRVAMGRAIVRSPKVFLMDEPLSNLDAKLRVQMRSDIIQLQARLGTTMVYVTHDQVEAMTMGHRVAVMRNGILQQVAPPQELYLTPANLFVASFIGSPAMNLITSDVTIEDGTVFVSFAEHRIRLAPGAVERYPGLLQRDGTQVIFGMRPEHFALAGDIDVGDDQIIGVEVELAEAMGAEVHVHTRFDVPPVSIDGESLDPDEDAPVDGTPIIARIDGVHIVAMGEHIRLALKTHLAHFFDPTDGRPLR
ncbi:MAG TPA: sn-glycerol-3-phosphate ABC transporter ATP-binding protein UgpC [Ilumatobacteraceae bacterium]|jgi:multiple sugar transport system ATP-binding protein|nr:sn-glycerol-3-phosphate ABC transporter ATP-binding protein UgpC [Ilumatobacteraceae bacterium]